MLAISPEKVCYIIIKAREFDVKMAPVISDPGGHATEDLDLTVLSDFAEDPVVEELTTFLEGLNEDESVTLLALMWIGRGDYEKAVWPSVLARAEESVDERRPEALLGIPLLSDYLEEGLNQFDQTCEDYEIGRM